MIARINPKGLLAAAVVVALVAAAFAFTGGGSTKTVTAYFSEAISVYKGSDVDIMGVRIGSVKAVVPDGDRVRVEIEYDGKYKLPADVKAAVITPTLVADRFVQLAPAYTGGAAMKDGGEIPLDRTAVPLELDKIYSSLAELTKTLGPEGANKKGALSDVLHAGAKALSGNGELGNETIAGLARAAQTLGDNSDQIFGTVDNLADLTSTLQDNDKVVGGFMTRLAKVSGELSGERGDLRKALVAIANAIGLVRDFVHDNKSALVGDIRKLTTTIGVLAKNKKTLGTVLQIAPLGVGNLLDAGDPESGSVGIRLQLGPAASDLPNMLCGVLRVNAEKSGVDVGPLCKVLGDVLPDVPTEIGAGLINLPVGSGGTTASNTRRATNLGDLILGRHP